MLSLTPTITKFIKRSCNFLRHFLKIYLHRKPLFSTFRYYRANPSIKNDFQIARNNITCSRINIFRVLASSRVRGTSFDIKIRNKFIEIKYSAPNYFIYSNWLVLHSSWNNLDDCTDLSLKMLGKSIKFISLLIKGILIECLIWLTLESMTRWRACWV